MHHLTNSVLKKKSLYDKILNLTAKIQKGHVSANLPKDLTDSFKSIYSLNSIKKNEIEEIKFMQKENLELLTLLKKEKNAGAGPSSSETTDLDEDCLEILELNKELDLDISSIQEEIKQFNNNLISLSIEQFQEYGNSKNYLDSISSKKSTDLYIEGCNLTIIGGAGGLEAQVFGNELLAGYKKYLKDNEWEFENVNLETTLLDDDEIDFSNTNVTLDGSGSGSGQGSGHGSGIGENKSIPILKIESEEAYKYLSLEHGVHRVQRVPFNSSRIQTSACAVNVVPILGADSDNYKLFSKKPDDMVQFLYDSKDILITHFKKASGAGGMNVNTGNTGRMVKHLPTGILVEAAVKEEYMTLLACAKDLKQKLLEVQYKKRQESLFGSVITSLDRSDKIRTYNFPQKRINDHRLSQKYNLTTDVDQFIASGGFDHFIEPLYEIKEESETLKLLEKVVDSIK